MPNVVKFESTNEKLDSEIKVQVSNIRGDGKYQLPSRGADLVEIYRQKIEGNYDVSRAKKDTDNAIDLLYIAYNTTPQDEGDIRVKISGVMDKLLKAQGQSRLAMSKAMRIADNVLGVLENILPDWEDTKAEENTDELRAFVKSDLINLAGNIKQKALSIKDELFAVASAYDGIIADTVHATGDSEIALGKRLTQKTALEDEINEASAERERLESLVSDLKAQVVNFDKKAREYESRAKTAEERAFIMSIVRVGAQVVSAAIPAFAMASGGPASVLAASAMGRTPEAKGDAGDDNGKSGAKSTGKAADSEDGIKTRKEISEKNAELDKAKKKISTLKEKKKSLKNELEIESKKNPKNTETPKKGQKQKDVKLEKLDQTDDQDEEIKEDDTEGEKRLKERINSTNKELKEEEEKVSTLTKALAGLQAALNALDKGLAKLSDDQQSLAGSLYQMQMQMLDKAEAYETERRNQSAQLTKIAALLKGQRSREETIHLCIKSLNLSLSALKRAKEIVEEIAFFFKSFADFMEMMSLESSTQMELLEQVAKSERIRSQMHARLLLSMDEFFIKQAAEWHATWLVAQEFNNCFASGWSKLNGLAGKYITGDELTAYFKQATGTLESIVMERRIASEQKFSQISDYRRSLEKGLAA
jgi:F420-0:gamma-glutamyl ligase-like protein